MLETSGCKDIRLQNMSLKIMISYFTNNIVLILDISRWSLKNDNRRKYEKNYKGSKILNFCLGLEYQIFTPSDSKI